MSSQRTLSFLFRPFDPSHYDRFVEIRNATYPDQTVTVSEWRSWDDALDKTKYVQKRFECVDKNTGLILGFGDVYPALDMFHPRKFMVNILVDPAYLGRGIGQAIYGHIEQILHDLEAIIAWSMVKEDLPLRVQFFHKRGFIDRNTIWESFLNIGKSDPAILRHYLDNATRQGITFTTLAEERQKGHDALKKIHELVQLVAADMPREAPFTPISYEQWETLSLGNPRLLPDGYIIAKHGQRYVGMSDVMSNETNPRVLSQDDTGVIREYRGRGIATALKLKISEFALKNGYSTIKTMNDSTNAAMLAVNIKLGFKRKVGWIMMEKTLQSDTVPA